MTQKFFKKLERFINRNNGKCDITSPIEKRIRLSSPLNIIMHYIIDPSVGILFFILSLPTDGINIYSVIKASIIGLLVISLAFIGTCRYLTVYGTGPNLVLSNPLMKDIIPLKDVIKIEQVSCMPIAEPEIRLTFIRKTKFGFTANFWPTDKYGSAKWFKVHPLVPKLQKLCEQART